jgi:ubiquitin carboxyl-terminal hydrolase 4/11/15
VKSHAIKTVGLDDCFKNFSKLEILKDDNEWYCNRCKTHTKAKKKMEIYNVPNILILHLKRFNQNNKITTLVDFPVENLDLTSYVKKTSEQASLYDLFAVCNHEGGLGGGHYFAYCKNSIKKEWYTFNDSTVTSMNETQIVTSAAYVLFYRKKDFQKSININDLYLVPFLDYEKSQEKKE